MQQAVAQARNGARAKTVITEVGPVDIDRESSFARPLCPSGRAGAGTGRPPTRQSATKHASHPKNKIETRETALQAKPANRVNDQGWVVAVTAGDLW